MEIRNKGAVVAIGNTSSTFHLLNLIEVARLNCRQLLLDAQLVSLGPRSPKHYSMNVVFRLLLLLDG